MRGRKAIGAVVAMAVLLAAVSPASAITTRDDRGPQLYLNLAGQAKYASVGRIDFTLGTSPYLASGTLISPEWVLTAAHVVDHATSMSFTVAGKKYTASQWLAFPQWTGNLMAGYDIGLMKLSAPVTGIKPATRYGGIYEAGQTATIVGYGMSGTGLTGSVTSAGTKRAAQNSIDEFYAGTSAYDSKLLLMDFDNPLKKTDNVWGSAKPVNLEGLIAPGDSGGGLFIDTAFGTYLAGVSSFTGAFDGKTNSDYGDIAGDTRVSAFNAWIDSILKTNATAGKTSYGMVAPLQAALVPEPATLGLAAAGLLGAWLGRRRKR